MGSEEVLSGGVRIDADVSYFNAADGAVTLRGGLGVVAVASPPQATRGTPSVRAGSALVSLSLGYAF